jgi:hypothetical protein
MPKPAPPPDLWNRLPPTRQQEVLHTLVPLLLAHLETHGPPPDPTKPDPKDKEKHS